jgi:large subunit GTPase 1
LLAREDLLCILERRAEEAAGEGARARRKDQRVVVGMVGYPNVGKSSTVNALVAKKKTGVSATPGKTKHFQTLELGDGLLLADCPGLVFPSFTASRAELVCNGVLPIDRLTDVRQPVSIVAKRIPRHLIERVYKMKLPLPALHEDQHRNATAGELLRAYSAARGLTVQHGRPDEQRAGRAVLKDFINGKLLFCVGPEGYDGPMGVAGDAIFSLENEEEEDAAADAPECHASGSSSGAAGEAGTSSGDLPDGMSPDDPLAKQLLAEMMDELGMGKPKAEKQRRAEHKFQKKSKVKGRIKNKGYGEDHSAGGDGFKMGKKGGMMPAHVQATVRSAVTDE